MSDATPMNCNAVREHLSDLLDLRRGATPPAEVALSDPGLRAQVESHLEGCAACRGELLALEEVGLAFAEFGVGERPVQDFSDYAAIVRERMNGGAAPQPRGARGQVVRGWSGWLGTAAASAAAAVLAVAFLGPREARSPAPVRAEARNEGAPERIEASVRTQPREPVAGEEDAMRLPKFGIQPLRVPKFEGSTLVTVEDRRGVRTVPVDPGAGFEALMRQFEEDMARLGEMRMTSGPCKDQAADPLGLSLLVCAEAKAADDDHPGGLAVARVLRGSPADLAGLRPGHYIQALNGVGYEKSTPAEAIKFLNALQQMERGETVQLDFAERKNSKWLIRRSEAKVGEYER